MMTPGQICPFHAPANMKQRTKKFRVQAANVAHLVECLPSMHIPLVGPWYYINEVWWNMPVIHAYGRWGQEEQKFRVFC